MNNELSNENQLSSKVDKMLNIPRDTVHYPDLPQDDYVRAANMIYKLSLISSCVDPNLQVLTMRMYLALSDYLSKYHTNQNDAMRLQCLKNAMDTIIDYCETNDNPLLKL